MGQHDDAVRALINRTQRDTNVAKTYADNIEKYPDPEPISGEVPDIVFEFSNGQTRIVEVDTEPMSDHDEEQDETFQRSAGHRKATTYEHHFAEDVLG